MLPGGEEGVGQKGQRPGLLTQVRQHRLDQTRLKLPSGLQDGLGGAIINYNQYYSLEPRNLWATNLVAAALGITFFLLVLAAEKIVVRRAPENVA